MVSKITMHANEIIRKNGIKLHKIFLPEADNDTGRVLVDRIDYIFSNSVR